MAIRKKNKSPGFWEVAKLNPDEFMLARNIEFAISNKLYFVIMYIIDPDIVIYSICKQIRESNQKIPNLPSDDMLEDVIGELVENLFSQLWMTTRDLNRGITELKNLVVARLSQNENQSKINRVLKQRW